MGPYTADQAGSQHVASANDWYQREKKKKPLSVRVAKTHGHGGVTHDHVLQTEAAALSRDVRVARFRS